MPCPPLRGSGITRVTRLTSTPSRLVWANLMSGMMGLGMFFPFLRDFACLANSFRCLAWMLMPLFSLLLQCLCG